MIRFCDDRHVSWNSKDHFIFIYGDLNNSYHNSAHFLKLHISSSFSEKILKEKAERILSTPGWKLLSVLKFAVSQACLCCSPLCKSQGGGALSNSNSLFVSCCCVFWNSSSMSLIQRLQWRWAGVRIICCNTMNEQERNVGD